VKENVEKKVILFIYSIDYVYLYLLLLIKSYYLL